MMELKLWHAVERGGVEEVKEILRLNPTVKVNWENHQVFGHPVALHRACAAGRDSIVSILLAHPGIDVNQKNYYGNTPFRLAFANGHTSCVRLLLEDFRVKVNEPANDRSTPLLSASYWGHIEVIRWWIVSGREMNLGTPGDNFTDVIGQSKQKGKTEVATLLERFKENPMKTRFLMRLELGCYDEPAAEIFALVVFVSDGLLGITKDSIRIPAARILNIVSQLPLELQMVFCYRLVGSKKELIPGKETEAAFKDLARRV